MLTCFVTILAFNSPVPDTAYALNKGSLDFLPNTGTYYVGDEFDVQVTISTDTPADAVDAFFEYTANSLQIIDITQGPAFQAYPGLQYNNPPGEVKITGFSVNNPLQGNSSVATMRLRALQPTNDAWIKYDFTLQNPPITTDSNIAKTITSEDILKSAGEAHFQIIPDTNPPYTTNHNPAPNANNVSRNTNISFRIRDDERGVDIDTVKVKVNGTTYQKGDPEFGFSGSNKNYHIVINPQQNFQYSQTVNVGIDGADIDNNQMNTFNYSFQIGDEPPLPNQPPNITQIDASDTTNKIITVEATDPDGPQTDLTFTFVGPGGTVFTDNGNGTASLDYSTLDPGGYFVEFKVTDAGSPPLSDTDGTWFMVAAPNQPTPPPPPTTPSNKPPRFKPVQPIETTLETDDLGNITSVEEISIDVEATDPDGDFLILTVEAPGMENFTFLDRGDGTGTLFWTPNQTGLFNAFFKAVDPDGLEGSLIVSVFVDGDTVCPAPTEPTELLVCPEPNENLAEVISERLPNELIATRAEVTDAVISKLGIRSLKSQKLTNCAKNLETCLNIFKINSNFEDKVISSQELVLYPDVPTSHPYSNSINLATLDGTVTGYYGTPDSPFKPDQATTVVEAYAIGLRALGIVPNLYKDELAAQLGGESQLKNQNSLCKDVDLSDDAQWWYPRYLNAAVQLGIITDTENCNPEQFITEPELDEFFTKLNTILEQNNYSATYEKDSDNDGITDLDEKNIFKTDPLNPDTDNDGLTDYEELVIYKTSPFESDSDFEGLSDLEEVKTHKTNPALSDSDEDGFTDEEEIEQGTDPLDAIDQPVDLNSNNIDDEWEKEFNLFNDNPEQATSDIDSDGDGLSDRLEFANKTNPLNIDTDDDGYSDSEEVLLYKTDPLTKTAEEQIKIKITNLTNGQVIANRKPTLQGIGPAEKEIIVVASNEFGHEIVLGKTIPEENNVFVFQVPIELQDGEYFISFRILDAENRSVTQAEPIRIIIDPSVEIKSPTPTKLDDKTITDDVILQNVRLEVLNNKPTLIGTTDLGNQVVAIWNSVVFTSALIADSATGNFSISAPKELPPGNHTVYVYAVDPGNQTVSETVKIPFEVRPKPIDTPPEIRSAIPDSEPTIIQKGQTLFQESGNTAYIFIGIILLLLLAYFIWRKTRKDETDDSNTNIEPPANQ